MTINSDAIRKMYIEVDAYRISDSAARKLTKILQLCEMELGTDGWYSGTNDHCKSVFNLLIEHEDILRNLTKWIYLNPEINAKEDCLETYIRCKQKWG